MMVQESDLVPLMRGYGLLLYLAAHTPTSPGEVQARPTDNTGAPSRLDQVSFLGVAAPSCLDKSAIRSALHFRFGDAHGR
jgi:hypothetical protein